MDDLDVLRKALDRAVADGNDAAAQQIAQMIAQAEQSQDGQNDVVPRISKRFEETFGFSPGESFIAGALSAGRGVKDIVRGTKALFGMENETTNENEQRLIQELEGQFPTASTVGRVTGQALPFVAAGPVAGGARALGYQALGRGAAPALGRGASIGGQAALGGAEGAIITAGMEDDATTGELLRGAGTGAGIAGAVEAVLPGFGRVLSRLGKRSVLKSNGEMPKDVQQAMNNAGISPARAKEMLADIKLAPGEELKADQLERYLRFKNYDIPSSKGDITGDFNQQAIEARLLESTQDELGDPMRSLRLNQSNAFVDMLNSQIKQLGVSDDIGQTVKDALAKRRAGLKFNKNSLYKQLAEESENVEQIPLMIGLPDPTKKRRISRLVGSEANALDDLLLEFGIGDPEEIAAFAEKGNSITPLTVNNSEEFLQAVNAIERKDQSNTIKVLTGPIKKQVDNEVDNVLRQLDEAGKSSNLGNIARRARATTRQLKTEFSPQSITGRLIDVKRDGVTPVIEASNVINQLFKRGSKSRKEDLQRTIDSLKRAGKSGQQAIRDLQSASLMRVLDESLGAATRTINGERVISGAQFQKALDKFGDEEFDILFKDQGQIRQQLKDFRKIAEDITPPSGAVPKGSASVILDLTNKLAGLGISSKLPFVGPILEGASALKQKAQRRAEAQAAGRNMPEYTKKEMSQLKVLRESMPQTAALLGLSQVNEGDE